MKLTKERLTKHLQDAGVPTYRGPSGQTIPLIWWLKRPGQTDMFLKLSEKLLGRAPYGSSVGVDQCSPTTA